MRRNPFEDLEELFDRIGREVEEGMIRGGGWPTLGSIPVDVAEEDDAFVVTADLPGYETDDIDLRLANGSLRIEAERAVEHEDEESGRYIRRERQRRSLSRSVSLPDTVAEDDVTASYNNGVLTVTLPKLGGGEDSTQIDIS